MKNILIGFLLNSAKKNLTEKQRLENKLREESALHRDVAKNSPLKLHGNQKKC